MVGKKRRRKLAEGRVTDKKETNISNEEAQILLKAQQKLEAKSKIYEKMQSGEMEDFENIYGETKYLVDFEKKFLDDADAPCNSVLTPTYSMSEADEMHREQLKEKWEQEQKDLLDGPVHYENIKFDEVRELGTGYYAFSKNEEERVKQMEELRQMRKQTEQQRSKKELLQQKRKEALQKRLDKVKQRKLNSEEFDILIEPISSSNQINNSSEISTVMGRASNSTVTESYNNKDTDLISSVNHVIKECRNKTKPQREWDKGKQMNMMGQSFVPQRKKMTSHDEYVEDKRKERAEEFAPPSFY